MKIAYLSTFYPYRGGIAQFNAALYREFEKKYEINAYTFFRQYPEMLFPGKSQMVGPDDNADPINAIRTLDTINPIGYFRAASKIKAFKPNLFITKYWMPFFAPSLGSVAKSLEKNCVNISILDNVIPHEKRPGDIKLTKFFLSHNKGFVVMSEAVRDDLLSLQPDAKYVMHTHPLYNHFGNKTEKEEARDKMNIPFGKKVLLFFGFIRDYKGLDLLIQALKNLPEDYYLVIAGEAYGSFDYYESLIQKLGLNDRVLRLVRYIPDHETALLFSAADLCVLPYKTATQSGIIGISYHFDLPVVATDVGGLKESIEPHNTGILAGAPTVDNVTKSIKKYFDENMQDTLSKNISEYKAEASWESLADSIINMYYEINGPMQD